MEKYRVEVSKNVDNQGFIRWYKFGTNQLHRLEGPAVEGPGGIVQYWMHGEQLTETKFFARQRHLNKKSCDGKVVEIDGKKYTLTEVK